jgi:hypothetical protein
MSWFHKKSFHKFNVYRYTKAAQAAADAAVGLCTLNQVDP